MKLYIYDHCPFCTRARLAFGLKQVPVDLEVILEGDVETPTRLIGRKVVPILQKVDGNHIGESLDIVHHVDGLGAPAFDDTPDPALDAWVEDAWGPGLKLFIPRFTRGHFPELATPAAREAYRLREEEAFGDLTALLADTPALLAAVTPKLEALTPLLEGREKIGINDITLWPVLRSLSIVRGLTFPALVRTYADRIAARSGVALLFDQAI